MKLKELIINKFLSRYEIIKKYCFLDENEKNFIKKNHFTNSFVSNESILIQCVEDHFFLILYSIVIRNEIKEFDKIYGLLTIPLIYKPIDILFIFPYLKKVLVYFLRKRKWKKLYKSIGVTHFIEPPEFKLFPNINNLFKAFRIFKNIDEKKDIINISYKDIKFGDLIYDSCVRFNKEIPSIQTNDVSLFLQIYKALNYTDYYFSIKNDIKMCFISYAVYTYHGIPARVFSKKNVPVYSSGNYEQMFKLVSKDHQYMMANFKYYNEDFESNFGDNEIKMGLKRFSKRFKGIDDTGLISSLSVNPYKTKSKIKQNLKLDGILFLHDFYDAHKLYGEVIFNDFYEWTIYTLDLIRKHKLKIGIKPHPHQLTIESENTVQKIKSNYHDLIWLDSNISNNILFNSGIKFGISHHGTVISELAYNNIVPICCSENPTSSFDFAYEAKSINDYKNLVLNACNLKVKNKNDVGKYYFMHYLNKKDDYKINDKLIKGINIIGINRFNANSESLKILN